MIKISNVVKKYDDIMALDDFSLEIGDDLIFALLGVNGAGKTTLLSVLNGLVSIDEGKVEVFGLDIKEHVKEIKAISSIIPQHLAFYDRLTVKENLDFFGKIQGASRSSYENAIEINSLAGVLDQRASTLSGGQKRRLNIAIGLLNDPKIIYFDEPTVGIDPKSRNEILDSIKSYKALGKTVIYTSHYMAEIEKVCDEVAIIDKGKLLNKDLLVNLLSNRVSDTILIEIIQNDRVRTLDIGLRDDRYIETTKESLFGVIRLLGENKIFIKQIKFGSTDLERYFIEVTN